MSAVVSLLGTWDTTSIPSITGMDKSWQTNKGLAETNMHMLNEEILCDVTFLMGENRRQIKAHKYMLVSRSPVFYAMFCGQIAESRDIIEIPDVEIDSFLQFLRFLYSENCDITSDSVMSLLYLGNKYGVAALADNCKNYLQSEMSPGNVCDILQQALTFDEQDLVKQSLAYIFKNGNEVLKSTGFVCFRKDVLHLIIESDKLQVKEENVYLACVRWAEKKCREENKDVNDVNVREALGLDLIRKIRFPLMQLDVFSDTVGERNVLSSEEKVDVFLQLSSKKEKQNTLFKSTPRVNRRIDIIRFEGVRQDVWNDVTTTDTIAFETSEDMVLVGISLFACSKKGKTACGQLEILNTSNHSLMSLEVTLGYTDTLFETIMFQSPFSIQKTMTYILKLPIAGTCFGENGVQCVNVGDIQVQFFNSSLNGHGTNTNRGQFRGLLFEIH